MKIKCHDSDKKTAARVWSNKQTNLRVKSDADCSIHLPKFVEDGRQSVLRKNT